MCFNGAVSGEGVDSKTMTKKFPRGVWYFLVEAHVGYQSKVWSNELWTTKEAGLTDWVASKAATSVYEQFVKAITTRGKATLPNSLTGYFSSRRILKLLEARPGRPGYANLLAKCGIRAKLCKLTTGLVPITATTDTIGSESWTPDVRTFLWVELIDEAVMAETGAVWNAAQERI